MPINGIKPRFIGYDNLGPFENQSIDYNRAMESRMLENVFGNCRGVDEYEKLNRIGEGTYGTVYRARDRRTNEIVALKRILLHNEQQNGFPLTAIREIKILQRLRHENCVNLLDVVVGKTRSSVFLVFEYCEHELGALVASSKILPNGFSESEIKRIIFQLLNAIAYLHDQCIIHRDLKMSNLLYNRYGELKLADFGLAREAADGSHMTPSVVTLWYRAPEVILHSRDQVKSYDAAIDIWAIGCIFGELWLHRPLFRSNGSEVDQLRQIFKLLGSPNVSIWPNMNDLSKCASSSSSSSSDPGQHALDFDPSMYIYNHLSSVFQGLSNTGLSLLNQMLLFDPSKRISAKEAMEHPYFQEKPYPKPKDMMPTFPSLHTG